MTPGPASTPWGGLVSYTDSTGSTMDDAQALEDGGAPEGSLAWAGFQTAGRGRNTGRTWVSAPGSNLLFTVFWSPGRFAVPGFAPSLTVGLGLCLWLEGLGLGPAVSLKWPNDVYLGDRKVAGILVRRRWAGTGPGSVHAGIGVNLRAASQEAGFRTPPTSLAEAGVDLNPGAALTGVLPSLALALAHPEPRSACEARLWRRDREIDLVVPGDPAARRGTVRGLDGEGRLVWDGPGGREAVSSGE